MLSVWPPIEQLSNSMHGDRFAYPMEWTTRPDHIP